MSFVVLAQCHWAEMCIVALDKSGNIVFDTREEAVDWANKTQAFPFFVVDLDEAQTPTGE